MKNAMSQLLRSPDCAANVDSQSRSPKHWLQMLEARAGAPNIECECWKPFTRTQSPQQLCSSANLQSQRQRPTSTFPNWVKYCWNVSSDVSHGKPRMTSLRFSTSLCMKDSCIANCGSMGAGIIRSSCPSCCRGLCTNIGIFCTNTHSLLRAEQPPSAATPSGKPPCVPPETESHEGGGLHRRDREKGKERDITPVQPHSRPRPSLSSLQTVAWQRQLLKASHLLLLHAGAKGTAVKPTADML